MLDSCYRIFRSFRSLSRRCRDDDSGVGTCGVPIQGGRCFVYHMAAMGLWHPQTGPGDPGPVPASSCNACINCWYCFPEGPISPAGSGYCDWSLFLIIGRLNGLVVTLTLQLMPLALLCPLCCVVANLQWLWLSGLLFGNPVV